MRVLIAMDKYKGSLTAMQAGRAVERGLRRLGVQVEVEVCAIADGGEGTTAALVESQGGQAVSCVVQDALGRTVEASYGLLPDGAAVMEMSAASGLALVLDRPLEPARASTFGTGEMMLHALKMGATRLIIGIGGSATNDAGVGMARALGYKFLDLAGTEVTDLPLLWEQVVSCERPEGKLPEVLVACDVHNPLLGTQGASAVYGPQKGVSDVAFFDQRLASVAALVHARPVVAPSIRRGLRKSVAPPRISRRN